MTSTQISFLRVLRHMGDFPLKLPGRPNVDQRFMGFALLESFRGKRSNLGVAAPRWHGISSLRILRFFFRDLTTFSFPLVSPSIKEAKIFVAKKRKDPQSVGCPPIGFIAVEYDGGVRRNANAFCQFSERLRSKIIADYLIIEIFPPIDVHGTGNVAGVIEQYIFVTFNHAD